MLFFHIVRSSVSPSSAPHNLRQICRAAVCACVRVVHTHTHMRTEITDADIQELGRFKRDRMCGVFGVHVRALTDTKLSDKCKIVIGGLYVDKIFCSTNFSLSANHQKKLITRVWFCLCSTSSTSIRSVSIFAILCTPHSTHSLRWACVVCRAIFFIFPVRSLARFLFLF